MPPLDDLTAPVPKVATEPKTASPPPDPTPTDTPRPVADAEPAPQAPVNATEVQGDRQSDGIQAEARVEGLTKPVYPMYSRRHGEEGTVVVSVEVSPDGAPRNARVVKPSGYRRLDQAALDAVKEARYVPAKRAGRPTSSLTEITFLFRLQDE
jgi:protein TonB